jgi:hypothetical protein
MGGPFQTFPRTTGDRLFAVLANAALWLALAWLLASAIRRVLR